MIDRCVGAVMMKKERESEGREATGGRRRSQPQIFELVLVVGNSASHASGSQGWVDD